MQFRYGPKDIGPSNFNGQGTYTTPDGRVFDGSLRRRMDEIKKVLDQ